MKVENREETKMIRCLEIVQYETRESRERRELNLKIGISPQWL